MNDPFLIPNPSATTMQFVDPPPRMSTLMGERVKMLVPERCPGWDCDSTTVRFVKRLIAASVTVHIQCQGCGKSFGALKRSEVYGWQDLPGWDESIRLNWDERREATRVPIPTIEEKHRIAAERRTDYRRWLMTSPDWRVLRDRVMRRALFICEACLANKAGDVHHITYELGRLPPAWELRAVCRACHDRLHDWTGGE